MSRKENESYDYLMHSASASDQTGLIRLPSPAKQRKSPTRISIPTRRPPSGQIPNSRRRTAPEQKMGRDLPQSAMSTATCLNRKSGICINRQIVSAMPGDYTTLCRSHFRLLKRMPKMIPRTVQSTNMPIQTAMGPKPCTRQR